MPAPITNASARPRLAPLDSPSPSHSPASASASREATRTSGLSTASAPLHGETSIDRPRASLGRDDAAATVRFVGHRATSGVDAAAGVDAMEGARTAAIQHKLDDLQARYSGPYTVAGQKVSARPMFRMEGGCNQAAKDTKMPELQKMCARAGVFFVPQAAIGRATPEQLVKITQVLLDNGKLPPGGAPVEDRIKQMQWQWGIGLDCAGYAFQATVEVHGGWTLSENKRNGHFEQRLGGFRRTAPEEARAGDVIHLKNPAPREPGHNVVVYSRGVVDAERAASLTKRHPNAASFLAEEGPIVALEVDASWGAGTEGSTRGGVRRDTWFFNTRTKEWGDFDPSTQAFRRSSVGPQGEAPTGAFRPFGAK